MDSNLFNFINQPYPIYYKGKQLVSFALPIFVMSALFNNFFEPFIKYAPEHRMKFF